MRQHESGESLARDVLDALSACIAVLDASGRIVAVNQSWRRFGEENGASADSVGVNYLEVCEKAFAQTGEPALASMIEGLQVLLAGGERELSVEYGCDSPTEKRWFQLRATRIPTDAGAALVLSHENITARKKTEQTLQETERLLRSMLEALPVGVWLMDASGRIVEGNPAGRQIWAGARYVGPEQYGEYKGWWLATGKPIAPDEWAAARVIRKGEISLNEEIEIECFDGTRKYILNSAVPLYDDQHAIHGAIIVNQDITARFLMETELHRAKQAVEAASQELSEALERERKLARIDSLTGAVNRRYLFELAFRSIAAARRYNHPLSIILFDLDEFKAINDELGHQAGDDLLQRIVDVVRTHLRASDVLARYGGDEFVVLLPHTRASDAEAVAERMRADVAAQTLVTPHGVVSMRISCGVSELLASGDTLDALIRRADVALYRAKRSGRNQTVVFSEGPSSPST